MKNRLYKIGKYFLYSVLVVFLIGLIGLVILYFKSPGEAEAIVDQKGAIIPKSISEIEKIRLGGIEQYIIIRGYDQSKPIMLFLHGGPGSPEAATIRKYNPDLEKMFVMVYWEQRGAGKSYSNSITAEEMKVEYFISDIKALSEHLIQRFDKKKIHLMGHSWGSFIGILAVHSHPELFYDYIGIGQVADQYRSEQLSLNWIKQQAVLRDDNAAQQDIAALQFPRKDSSAEEWIDYLLIQRSFVDKFGGGLHRENSTMWKRLKPLINNKSYTVSDKVNFGKGVFFSLEHLWSDLVLTNLFEEIDSIAIPVYFFHGRHDNQTVYPVAYEFYEHVKTPKKEFFTFEDAAHSPIFDNSRLFNERVESVVADESY